jgi:hypothetical protein
LKTDENEFPLRVTATFDIQRSTSGVDRRVGVLLDEPQAKLEVDTGGVVDVIDRVESHKSKWFLSENFGWILANPRRLKFRRCKDVLNLSGRNTKTN